MIVLTETIQGNCGISYIYDIMYDFGYTNYPYQKLDKNIKFPGGCGWQIAGFIDTKQCKDAYDKLKTFAEIVYQAPVRVNRNSGNKFFFVLYNTYRRRKSKSCPLGEKPNLTNNSQYEWPL